MIPIRTLITAIAISLLGTTGYAQQSSTEKEWVELRTYEVKTGAKMNHLVDYLNQVLAPTLKSKGAREVALFKELGDSEPRKLYLMVTHQNATSFLYSQELHKDPDYSKRAKSYNAIGIENTLYNRISSMLLLSFDRLPKMDPIKSTSTLFELRTYESYSEDANRRKIDMFNDEELDLFYEVGLHPVFFGEQIIGPQRPALTYIIQFKDQEEHDLNWKKFIDSEKWKVMSSKAKYANTATKIHKVFLTRIF
ncbi:MAG: hypothetical protein RLZZ242_191 [Bacteroidota bacterium]|jgi:hypothetical protein